MHAVKLDEKMISMILDVECEKSTFAEKLAEFDRLISPTLDSIASSTGFFAKLTSRSPKDYTADFKNFTKPKAIYTPMQILDSLMNSERTFEDLCRFKHLGECNLFIRTYQEFEAKHEWRVFVKDGKINGISQYYYGNDFGYSEELMLILESDIRTFINDKVTPEMRTKTYVVDVIADGNTVTLLETNPYGLSDPCLFGSYANLRDEMLWEVHQ